MEKILFKMDHDELKGLVFVDFSKGFDVIDHNLSLKKLSVYSASPDSVVWFQYIVTRWVTKIGHITSKAKICRLARGTTGINPRSSFISPICE